MISVFITKLHNKNKNKIRISNMKENFIFYTSIMKQTCMCVMYTHIVKEVIVIICNNIYL